MQKAPETPFPSCPQCLSISHSHYTYECSERKRGMEKGMGRMSRGFLSGMFARDRILQRVFAHAEDHVLFGDC